jgi:hypothetical protein
VAARRGGDYVAREQHERLEIELATTKEQLIETLEELNSRELELTEVGANNCLRTVMRHMCWAPLTLLSVQAVGEPGCWPTCPC